MIKHATLQSKNKKKCTECEKAHKRTITQFVGKNYKKQQ
jgi:hypothetical protein